MKTKIIFSLVLLASGAVPAQEASETFRAGPTLAVQEADLKLGFKLFPKAQQVIGVKILPLKGKPYSVPTSSLVFYGARVGIYRVREGWFKLVEVQVTKSDDSSLITSSELKEGDQFAAQGVALLRVSEMDAFGGEQ